MKPYDELGQNLTKFRKSGLCFFNVCFFMSYFGEYRVLWMSPVVFVDIFLKYVSKFICTVCLLTTLIRLASCLMHTWIASH